MIRLTQSQLQPIGVDIGFDSIRMLQLEVTRVGGVPALSVLAAEQAPMPEAVRDDPRLMLPVAVEQIRKMLRRGRFSGRSAVVALPREMVHVKNLRLPPIPPTEIESAVRFEAHNVFPFETEQAQIRHLYAGEIRQGNDVRHEVIVLAARHAEVDDFIEMLHRGGLVVESLDFEPCALYRGVERFIRRREDEQDVNVLVDIGARRTNVVIGRGRDIQFYKPIDIGGEALNAAVAQKLGITPEEARTLRRRIEESQLNSTADADMVLRAVVDASRPLIETLAREIGLCLRYYSVTFRGQRPGKLRLLGGEAADATVRTILNSLLPVPSEAGRPLHSVDCSRIRPGERQGYTCAWAVALGLGLKQTTGYFGARDGKARDPNAGRTPTLESSAQVVDLTQAQEGHESEVAVQAPERTPQADAAPMRPSRNGQEPGRVRVLTEVARA